MSKVWRVVKDWLKRRAYYVGAAVVGVLGLVGLVAAWRWVRPSPSVAVPPPGSLSDAEAKAAEAEARRIAEDKRQKIIDKADEDRERIRKALEGP